MEAEVREPREIGGASQKTANIKNAFGKHPPSSIRHTSVDHKSKLSGNTKRKELQR
jgi:hypothetical protein